MFSGDFTVQDLSLDDPFAIAQLGPEARSILKSIQTEDAKLKSSGQPARSDLHYFRARFNYYRLSLLRLQPEEKSVLEPVLARFLHHIVNLESEAGEGERGVTPFLAPVEKYSPPRTTTTTSSAAVPPTTAYTSAATQPRATRLANEEILSQLHLIKMALASDIDALGRKALSDGLDRVIHSLRNP